MSVPAGPGQAERGQGQTQCAAHPSGRFEALLWGLWPFLCALTQLGPFGRGNEEPVFCLKRQQLTNMREVGRNHLRFTVQDDGTSINGIGFNLGHYQGEAKKGLVDLAFTLRFNTFRGSDRWEMQLKDLRPTAGDNF